MPSVNGGDPLDPDAVPIECRRGLLKSALHSMTNLEFPHPYQQPNCTVVALLTATYDGVALERDQNHRKRWPEAFISGAESILCALTSLFSEMLAASALRHANWQPA